MPRGLNADIFCGCPLSHIYVPAGKTEDFQAALRSFAGCVTEISGLGSTLSESNVWIVIAVGAAAVIAVGAIVIVKKKKKIPVEEK